MFILISIFFLYDQFLHNEFIFSNLKGLEYK